MEITAACGIKVSFPRKYKTSRDTTGEGQQRQRRQKSAHACRKRRKLCCLVKKTLHLLRYREVARWAKEVHVAQCEAVPWGSVLQAYNNARKQKAWGERKEIIECLIRAIEHDAAHSPGPWGQQQRSLWRVVQLQQHLGYTAMAEQGQSLVARMGPLCDPQDGFGGNG